MRLVMHVEGEERGVTLPGEGRDLIGFMSFAAMRGFGAQHPLLALADHLHSDHGVRMGPLTTFYDGTVEDVEDAEKIELAWQEPRALREVLQLMTSALENDERCAVLVRRADASGLAEQARALIEPLREAEEGGHRVRLVYEL